MYQSEYSLPKGRFNIYESESLNKEKILIMKIIKQYYIVLIWAIMISASLYSMYLTLDVGVSLTYGADSNRYKLRDRELLQKILPKIAEHHKRAEITEIIKKRFATDYIIKETKDEISIDDVILIFNDKTLVKVDVN